jgi:hypothetical protein
MTGTRDASASLGSRSGYLVELWFSIIERQAIQRGTFGSVKDLNAKVGAFIIVWNDLSHPLGWANTADRTLKKAALRKLSHDHYS